MKPPSIDDAEKTYPKEEWNRDLVLWFSRAPLANTDHPAFVAYFQDVQRLNPARDENCGRMWMALAFLQAFLADLERGGAVSLEASGKALLPPALVTALYRAYMSPVAALSPRAITVPLILQVVKQQKDWNEDRT
jgi:hypothetical protein